MRAEAQPYVIPALGAVTLVLALASLAIGPAGLSFDNSGQAWLILSEIRLPRTLLGVLVGAAFGTAGSIFQTTLRNPLASPDILGVNFGASAMAVFAIVTLGATGSSSSGSA